MKTRFVFLISLSLLIGLFIGSGCTTIPVNAQTTFQVWGNCEMCKKTIESAANSLTGVGQSEWNVDSHEMRVSYDSTLTNPNKIRQAIADAGYDTDSIPGNDSAYNHLHECCQYERKK